MGGPGGALLEALGASRYDIARFSGAPVDFAQGRNRVRAPAVTAERRQGRTLFSGGVSGDFSASEAPESPPLRLACRTLSVTASPTPAGPKPDRLEAVGEVRLEGLMEKPGEEPGRAEAERFVWSLLQQQGLLEGRPLVRLVQGRNLILAPRVLLEGRSTIILKGPKRFRLAQRLEDRETVYVVSSEGDVVVDAERGRTTLADRCCVRSEDFRLQADRMEIELSPDGKSLRGLRASGNVRARRAGEDVTLYGDRVRFDPKDRSLSVIGYPRALAEAGGRTVRTREIRFNERSRTTLFRGGSEGVLLVIDEPKK